MKKPKWTVVIAVMLLALWAAAPVLAEQATITGMVTEDFQIVDNNGQSYDVADSAMGDELISKAAGKNVEVTGTVEEEGGVKTIMVESYKILEE